MPKKKEKKIVDTGFVPGIYNYCDRWCERCPLQLRCKEAFATFDGQKGIQLSSHDVVNIETAQQVTKLIKITDHSFYDILKRKIGKMR